MEAEFGPTKKTTQTLAYLDTMASFNFLSKELFGQIKERDPKGETWKESTDVLRFTVAVGKREFVTPAVDVRTRIGSWIGWVRYGVGQVNADCILGAMFCRKYVQFVDYPTNYVALCDRNGTHHDISGIAAANERTSFYMCDGKGIGPATPEVEQTYVVVLPKTTAAELDQEEEDLA
ncbi:MAG: hypothetical protein ACO330_05615, partial [Aquiluna sp.]